MVKYLYMANKLTKKHDELSKKFLTDVSMAREFLQLHLDKKIIAKCDLSTLHIDSGSYIDDDLQAFFSDISTKTQIFGLRTFVIPA